MTGAIVTTHYRYKRPPRKRAKAAAIEGPAIVAIPSKKGKVSNRTEASNEEKAAAPANDDRKSAIVTVRRKGRFGDVPDLTPEELRRRADAADALWRELVRRVNEASATSPSRSRRNR